MQEKYWKNLGQVTVHGPNGRKTYSCLEAAVRAVGYHACSSLKYGHPTVRRPYVLLGQERWLTSVTGDDHVFYTQEGIVIHPEKVKEYAEQFCDDKYYRYYRRKKFKFRQGPVEGIRCWRPGRYYRPIRTTQERRENAYLKYDEDAVEYEVKARPSRSKDSLPNAWDDIPYSKWWGRKSWKRYRKTQWRE